MTLDVQIKRPVIKILTNQNLKIMLSLIQTIPTYLDDIRIKKKKLRISSGSKDKIK